MNNGTSEFSKELLKHFKADKGAYSKVTDVEASKRQVVTRVVERDLFESFFKEELATRRGKGGKGSLLELGEKATSTFRVYPSGLYINLPLLYPKLNKRELRLYFNKGQFSPTAEDYWCTFLRGNELWLGTFTQSFLDNLEKGAIPVPDNPRDENFETEVDAFQELLNRPPSKQVSSTSLIWRRDPKVSRTAFRNSDYICEMYPDMPYFISRSSGKPYMEAHHFIPMKHQPQHDIPLDVVENICVLNPYAHRELHHAKYTEIKSAVLKLAKKREEFLDKLGLKPTDTLAYYS